MSIDNIKNHDLIWDKQENYELEAKVFNENVSSDKEEYHPGWRSYDCEAIEESLEKGFSLKEL